ncbi:MAG: spermidine/putrescine ABC transporter substrate-binding protein [Eubacteriales bacterium]|nr:spermidine/putrescine ABC transporter substrate-binding protein [Eubacteriales bacterium]MDD4474493.1 spermidine/putrescine ABC transporter substrate-binding protein [Eubacteriales bacterium]
MEIKMKKTISLVTMFILVFSMFSGIFGIGVVADDNSLSGTTINVYNWGEYIPDGSEDSFNINAEFTKRTGINVNYNTYSSNEDLYSKLKNGGANYDIIIPSDYMIERLIKEDLVQKIDFTNVPNYSYISEDYKNLEYDPNNEYSVPYAAGLVGIIYNTEVVEGTPDSWSIMWDEKYAGKILNINNPRDAFATSQFLLGIDINTTNLADWDRAAEKIKEELPILQKLVMDEIFNLMESGEAAIAPYYAGDFFTMKEINDKLAFFYPKEGTNFFVDAMCIPKDAENKAGAEAYINFLLEPDISLEIAEYINYMTPNTAVLDNDEYTHKGNEILYPSEEVMSKSKIFRHLPTEVIDHMNTKWDEIKLGNLSVTVLIVCLAAVIAIIVAFVIYKKVQKKRRDEA